MFHIDPREVLRAVPIDRVILVACHNVAAELEAKRYPKPGKVG